TIAGNDTTVGLLDDPFVTSTILGSIIDQPGGSACSGGTFRSVGYNLVSDSSCNFTATGDRQSTAAQLGPLADHRGPTKTRLPITATPAVNQIPIGTPGLCSAGVVDQRGVVRPVGTSCDKGSVEGSSAIEG